MTNFLPRQLRSLLAMSGVEFSVCGGSGFLPDRAHSPTGALALLLQSTRLDNISTPCRSYTLQAIVLLLSP